MKFLYEYRTSDNVRHEGVINAASRDAAFVALKKNGIRPGSVVEAPGVFNKLLGKGKRWAAIVVLGAVSGMAVFYARRANNELASSGTSPTPRHQVYGEPVLMDRIARDGYSSVFSDPGDRFLALYAQPGHYVKPVDSEVRKRVAAELQTLRKGEVSFSEDDPREIRELKRIILWMREELDGYLSNGKGTTSTYIKRLEERQIREFQIYNNAKYELEHEKDMSKWDRRNASLRAIGLPTIQPNDADQK